jgi:hypothetical protein
MSRNSIEDIPMDEEPTKLSPLSGKLDEASVWYEKTFWLRAVIQGLPSLPPEVGGLSIGGPIDTLLASRGSQIARKRLEELIFQVSRRLESVEEGSLDRSFLQSDEFFDILRESIRIAARTSSEEKRVRIAAFLAGAILEARVGDLSEQILHDLDLLKDFHLAIIDRVPEASVPSILNKTNSTLGPLQISLHLLKEKSGLEQSIFNKGIADLIARGFIRAESVGTTYGHGDVLEYRSTGYLRLFRDAIQNRIP